jgi:hypothetical protein
MICHFDLFRTQTSTCAALMRIMAMYYSIYVLQRKQPQHSHPAERLRASIWLCDNMSAMGDIGVGGATPAATGYFVDQKKGEVNELKQVRTALISVTQIAEIQ